MKIRLRKYILKIICIITISISMSCIVYAYSNNDFYEYDHDIISVWEDENTKSDMYSSIIWRKYDSQNDMYIYKNDYGNIIEKTLDGYRENLYRDKYTIDGKLIHSELVYIDETTSLDLLGIYGVAQYGEYYLYFTEDREFVIEYIELGINGDRCIQYRTMSTPAPEYTLTLSDGINEKIVFKGASESTYKLSNNDIFSPPNNEIVSYKFLYWVGDDYTMYETDDLITIPNRDITLYAYWIPDIDGEFKLYSAYFESNGGTGIMENIDGFCYFKITLPICDYIKDGYTFSHWTDGTNNYQAGDTYIVPDHDVTMSAVWKKDIVIPPIPDDKDKDNDKDDKNKNSTISFINTIIAQTQAIITDDTTQPTETKYVCPYKDISGHWGEDIIKYISEYGLMDGITETQFKPDAPMTREVFFIAMARLAGITENHIDWAKSNGILMGYGNGEYGLQDTITREQMAVIFKRFLDKMEIDLTDYKTVTKKQFADHGSISSWAVDSVYEIQEIGLVKGKSNNMFDPLGNTTRAEGATVLYNLIQTIIEKVQ